MYKLEICSLSQRYGFPAETNEFLTDGVFFFAKEILEKNHRNLFRDIP